MVNSPQSLIVSDQWEYLVPWQCSPLFLRFTGGDSCAHLSSHHWNWRGQSAPTTKADGVSPRSSPLIKSNHAR